MERTKVSIIVPVYNIPTECLRKCLESAVKQSLKEIEIILVDDGSTDISGIICDEYASKDSRIKVIHKTNEGLAAARNTGFEMSTGEWVTFLDSDDWIDPHTCEDIYILGEKNCVDLVLFGTVQEFGHYSKPFKYKFENGKIFEKSECQMLQCEILDFSGNIATAWAKFFKRSFLKKNGLLHNSLLRQGSEGIEFNIRVFEKVERVYFTSKVYYHYVFNPNSISAKHDERNHFFVIGCFEEIEKQIHNSKNRIALQKRLYTRFCYTIIAAGISGYFSPCNHDKYPVQKQKYIEYLHIPFVEKSLQQCNKMELDSSRRILYTLIRHKMYLPIKILAWLRYYQKRIA